MLTDISVVLPFYNAESTFALSIESILNQTFQNFELILINNGSLDSSLTIARHYAKQDKRVRIVSEPEKGIVYALNTGIVVAKGSYIARMDADDISLPERLDKQFQFLKGNPEYGLVASCVKYIHDEEMQYGFYEYVKWNNTLLSNEDISLNRFIESPLVHPSVMFKRDLIAVHGGYRSGDFPEDYELWLRWIDAGVKMHKLPEKLLEWKDSTHRLTRTDERYSNQAFFETKSRHLFTWLENSNKFHPDAVIWGAGRLSRQRFSILHELGVNPKFFIDLRTNAPRNVIEYTQTPPPGKHFIISYVANRDARNKIRDFLIKLGYKEGVDFICVA